MSRVSIIIPCFDDGEFLEEATQSALEQTHDDLEIIVVDDGSTDPATRAALTRVAADTAVEVMHQPNAGVGAARNLGISRATGDYVLPLDADDRLAPGYAASAAAVLDGRPEIGIVGGEIEYIGLRSGRERPRYVDVRTMLVDNGLFTASMTRRSDWEAVGGYPRDLPVLEDWVYWLRILGLGREVHILDDVVWFYRQREGQVTRTVKPEAVTRATIFAMRDQPRLFSDNFDLVVDMLEERMQVLDGFRRRYGRVNDLLAGAAGRWRLR